MSEEHILRYTDLAALIHGAGFTQLTTGKLMHGMLTGVAAVNPERSAQE